MRAFTPANPKRDEFAAHLNKSLQARVGLVCSLPESMFKTTVVRKINGLMENEATPCLRATEVLGRTKEIDNTGPHVYVLYDKVFKRPPAPCG